MKDVNYIQKVRMIEKILIIVLVLLFVANLFGFYFQPATELPILVLSIGGLIYTRVTINQNKQIISSSINSTVSQNQSVGTSPTLIITLAIIAIIVGSGIIYVILHI